MDTKQEDQNEKPARLRFAKIERTLDCILTKEDREERSKESHALTAMIEEKERDQDELKSRASAVGKEIDRLVGQQRKLSKAAHTGQESRTIFVHKEYDKPKHLVYEVRDDTGAELGTPRRPYPSEENEINNILQADLFDDVDEEAGQAVQEVVLPEWIQARAKELAAATQGKPKLLNLPEFIDMIDGLDKEPFERQRLALAFYQQEHDRQHLEPVKKIVEEFNDSIDFDEPAKPAPAVKITKAKKKEKR